MPMPICYARVIASGLGLGADDCSALLLGSGLSSADLEADERAVGFQQQRQIIVNALRISGNPALGLRVGSMAPLATHGALRAAERQCARELLALQAQASFAAQVQAAVAGHLARGCSMAVIARLFRISVRTLVRRLALEQTSYRLILDEVRKLQARRYLSDPAMSIGEIAQCLGYQDPSNFGRACRGWFKLSPSAFREQQNGAGGPMRAPPRQNIA